MEAGCQRSQSLNSNYSYYKEQKYIKNNWKPEQIHIVSILAFQYGRSGGLARLRAELWRGSDSPPDCHSLPRPSSPFTPARENKKQAAQTCDLFSMVGVKGLEPSASWSRTKRSTKLSYTPIPEDYNTTGNTLQVFFESIFGILKRKKKPHFRAVSFFILSDPNRAERSSDSGRV